MPRMSHSASSSWATSASQSCADCGSVATVSATRKLVYEGCDEGCVFEDKVASGCHAGKVTTGGTAVSSSLDATAPACCDNEKLARSACNFGAVAKGADCGVVGMVVVDRRCLGRAVSTRSSFENMVA